MSLDPCLAVIPARGGSKGLPGKNIRPFAGLPLLVHSLRCAALLPRLADVIVSTDSEEIAAVARAHGGNVPFLRPAELAADDTPMVPVLAHALSETSRLLGRTYRSLLLLDPTSPTRLPEDIERAFTVLGEDAAAVGAISCSRPTFNPFFSGVVESDGYLSRAFDTATWRPRRQDFPAFFRINGAVYLWRAEYIARAPTTWLEGGPHRMIEIPETRAFSLDDLDEFERAELMVTHGKLELPWLKQSAAR